MEGEHPTERKDRLFVDVEAILFFGEAEFAVMEVDVEFEVDIAELLVAAFFEGKAQIERGDTQRPE